MTQLVFFLEEPSAREMLIGLLPKLLPDNISTRYVVFEGKQDLHKRLGRKLRGWLSRDVKFVVLRDKDSGDCVAIKRQLQQLCHDAGKDDVLIRIACHELESWYLGDLKAVEQGLKLRGIVKKQNSRKFREPDYLANPAQELFRLTKSNYQKVGGSRKIGPFLTTEGNKSHSFNAFISGIDRIIEGVN